MEQAIVEPKKATFMESVGSGIKGYFKGFFAGGLVGAIGGAVIGAIVGALIPGAGAMLAGLASIVGVTIGGSGALAGAAGAAIYGGALFAGVGALAGTVTGVVKSREKNQVSARDVVNVATISYAQGMGVGHQIGQEQAIEEVQSHFRDKILKERAARATSHPQVH